MGSMKLCQHLPSSCGCANQGNGVMESEMGIRMRRGLSRRRLLTSGASIAALAGVGGIARPSISRAADRPQVTHGVQSGDVSADSGVIWARVDRPARMRVEISTTDRF
jgi:alkaline phosphatase D